MERYFYRRGERVPVTQVDGVVAVQVDEDQREALLQDTDASTERLFGEPATGPRVTEAAFDVDEDEARGLRESGWVFVRPGSSTDGTSDDVAAESALSEPAREVGTVYTQTDGHLLIGTRSVVVQFDAELSEDEARARAAERGLSIVRELRFAPNQFEVTAPAGADVLDVANELHESGGTVFAEPSFVEYIGQRLRPADPVYAQQWQLNNTGAAGGVVGADIRAERAWDITRGAGVTVAVIDNGFDARHGDLAPALTDGCGFFDGTGTFRRTLTNFPDSDHGTFCAGMAAARQNTVDGSGSAPQSDLLLVASQGDQVGTQVTLARALAYAADPRMEVANANPADAADVIVCSLGPNGANWALTTVLQNAIEFTARRGRRGRGTPIFWASSNGNVDVALDQVVSHRDVIAVGRSRRTDLEDNSARGEELDFLAPGVNVVSTASGGGTRTGTGTSYAAPLAAGVGALLLAVNPDLSAEQVRHLIRRTCDRVGGVTYDAKGHNLDYGYGRVNAFRAVVHALSTVADRSGVDTDHDGDRLAEVPVTSPWGLGTLEHRRGALTHLSMAPNGSRFDGWLLNTVDNRFPVHADLDGDGRSELLVTSPWGVGVLETSGGTYRGQMLRPNGTRFGGWLLNTADNRFGPVGDFDGDGRDEVLITSPWGIALLKLTGTTFSTVVMAANGTRFGGWLLNTADNQFGPVGDFDGDGRDEVIVRSPWGIGMLKLSGATFAAPMMARNGTRFGGWLLNTDDNWFGPAGDVDGDGRDELVIASPWGVGVLELAGSTMSAATMAPNGTRFGGWLLNTHDNRFRAAADLDGDGRDELFVTSPWGVGVLELTGGGLTSVMLTPNGTRFGGWLLNTAADEFRRFAPMTARGRAEVLVESPWGVGLLRLDGDTFTSPYLAPNGTRLGGWVINTADNRL